MEQSPYARPLPPRIIARPLLVTLALHAALVYAITWNFSSAPEASIKPKPLPRIVNAKLVSAQDLAPEPKPKPKPRPAKKVPKPVAKPKPQPRPKPKPVAKTAPKTAPKEAPRPTPKPEPKPEPRMTAEELAALTRNDLADAVAEEEEAFAAASADQLSVSYQAMIRQTVTRYWSRPPTARNGMETLLLLQLIPTGEVIAVTVERSSGDSAFDRSAVNAVKKAEQFPELAQLPPRVFNRDFRRLRLLFKPEDLRY